MTRYYDLIELAATNADTIARCWYDDARAQLEAICGLENWDADRFTGLLAVLSPRVSVRRNIRLALQYQFDGIHLTNVVRSVRRSVEILEARGEIRGRKTSEFYAALRGNGRAIVLDTHMANLFGVPQKTFALKTGYAYWAGIVNGIAAELELLPSECQACLWFGHKRKIGDKPGRFPIMEEYNNWILQNRQFPSSGAIDSFDTIAQPLFDNTDFAYGANVA